MPEDKKNISVIGCVLVENENQEFLVMRTRNFGDKWWLPGGHVEYGEDIREATKRELKEETGIETDDLKFLGTTELYEPKDYKKKKHFVTFYFKTKIKGEQELTNGDQDEVVEYAWMTVDELKKEGKASSLVMAILDKLEKGECCASCEEYKAGWQRAQADYKNLQQEIENNKSKWAKMSEVQILEEFIPVLDNFHKAFNVQDVQNVEGVVDEKWKEGIGFIMKQFENVLTSHGVEKIKTVGEEFNPELHEAVGEEEGEEEGVVLKEAEAGYVVDGKVLRAAKVIVSKI